MEQEKTKKFDRLPPEKRKEEIRAAATALFMEKGFAATTMENIVERVSLSKGGVYRLYPSTTAILSDLMLEGMELRNEFYVWRAAEAAAAGQPMTLGLLTDMICDSLLLSPELSGLYVEFLWEKRRSPELAALYDRICTSGAAEALRLMEEFGADRVVGGGSPSLRLLTDLMNTAILGLTVLDLREPFERNKKRISALMAEILTEME